MIFNISDFDLGWVAGILEGEGCFHLSKRTPGIKLSMTDLDVVIKFCSIINYDYKRISKYKPRGGTKVVYTVNYYGVNAFRLMQLLKPHMCGRREQKINEIIDYIMECKIYLKYDEPKELLPFINPFKKKEVNG